MKRVFDPLPPIGFLPPPRTTRTPRRPQALLGATLSVLGAVAAVVLAGLFLFPADPLPAAAARASQWVIR